METPVALYARVSSDEQAERGTIAAQQTFLRAFVALYQLPVAGEYADDGVSGTLPLPQRPAGATLVADAQAKRFGVVLVYRVDRLGRSLAALLDAHTVLSAASVTLRSATEPFDTSTPIGTFMFQLLGSMAELDRAQVQERMSLGKERRVREGYYVGGAIPLGYCLDAARRLVVSEAEVAGYGLSEPAFVVDVFERMAAGSSVMAECRRLNALGVPPGRRYPAHHAPAAPLWHPRTLVQLLRNPVYRGEHQRRSQHGLVTQAVPALVSVEVWEQAQAQLRENRHTPKANAQRLYLLRGLLRCGLCGTRCVGERLVARGKAYHYYRCGRRRSQPTRQLYCPLPRLRAERVEAVIWGQIRTIVADPGAALAQKFAEQHQGQQVAEAVLAAHHARVQQALAHKQTERQYILTASRRGLIPFEDLAQQLEQVQGETAVLEQELAALTAQVTVRTASVEHYATHEAMLAAIHGRLEELERVPSPDVQREICLLLVEEVRAIPTPGTPPYTTVVRWAWEGS